MPRYWLRRPAAHRLARHRAGLPGQNQGDLLHVLGGCGQEALAGHADEAAEAGVAVAEQLFGVGEGALHRLLAPLVDRRPQSVSRWASTLSRASAQTWRVIVRSDLAFDVQEARNGALNISVGSSAGRPLSEQ